MFLSYSSVFFPQDIVYHLDNSYLDFLQGCFMTKLSEAQRNENIKQAAKRALLEAEERKKQAKAKIMAPEINGPKGPEPTRFDDLEKKGIICDF